MIFGFLVILSRDEIRLIDNSISMGPNNKITKLVIPVMTNSRHINYTNELYLITVTNRLQQPLVIVTLNDHVNISSLLHQSGHKNT